MSIPIDATHSSINLYPNKFAIVHNSDSYNDHTSEECHFLENGYIKRFLCLGKTDITSFTSRRNVILMFHLVLWGAREYNGTANAFSYVAIPITQDFNPETVTGEDIHMDSTADMLFSNSVTTTYPNWTNVNASTKDLDTIKKILNNGLKIWANADDTVKSEGFAFTTLVNNWRPQYSLSTYDVENGYDARNLSPQTGFVPKYSANTFNWQIEKRGESWEDVTLTATKFRWRVKDATTYTEYDCEVGATSYTVPANTFNTPYIEWSVALSDSFGKTTESSWYLLNTIETTSKATADSPANDIIDNTKSTVFKWSHIISTGTNATKSELQISSDGATWTNFATVNGASLTYSSAPYSISTGTKYWRVRTYNTDNEAGSWSESRTFISLGQPNLRGVSVEATPRPTIRWQSNDFKGYQVKVDNVDYGVKYGVLYSFKLPQYLSDGEHTAKVRIINEYGLWSDWQTASFNVTNSSEFSINLNAYSDGHIAKLNWGTTSNSSYIVYRDGMPIAKTEDNKYDDYLAVGEHKYYVRGIYSNSDNYNLSNEETIALHVSNSVIADVQTQSFMNLKLCSESVSTISFGIQSKSNARHYNGTVYPVAELSKQKALSVNGSVAFTSIDECAQFEMLIGKVVCMKLINDIKVIGLLTSQTKKTTNFFTEYIFSITQTEFNEEIEI